MNLLKSLERTYLEALLLAQQDIVHTLLDLLGGSFGVGDLITSANLLPQALLEVGLASLVLFDLATEVPASDVDLGLHTAVAGAGGLLDLLQKIAEVTESVVHFILDVVQSLASDLVLLSGTRVEQSVLSGGQLALALGAKIGNTVVDLSALVQQRRRVGRLVVRAHF